MEGGKGPETDFHEKEFEERPDKWPQREPKVNEFKPPPRSPLGILRIRAAQALLTLLSTATGRNPEDIPDPTRGIPPEKIHTGVSGHSYESFEAMQAAGDNPFGKRELKMHRGVSGRLYPTVADMVAAGDQPTGKINPIKIRPKDSLNKPEYPK